MRILQSALIIWVVLGVGTGVNPPLAFSQNQAVLEKLKKKAVNFHEAGNGVYRSGLISEEAVPLLKELGIKTVVSFDNHLKRAEKEADLLRHSGIEPVLIPWSGWGEPNDETIAKIISLMESPDRKPILVHCKHGQERTGVAVACWRIEHQGWSAEEAYREMKAHGFRPFRYGHLKEYVYQFARRRGDRNAEIKNVWERMRTAILSFCYQLIFPAARSN